MKVKLIKISKPLMGLRPDLKLNEIYDVVAKSNTAEQMKDNPSYLIYGEDGKAISLYSHEIEEINTI